MNNTYLGSFVSYYLLKIPYSRAVAVVSFISLRTLISANEAASNNLALSYYVKNPGTDKTISFSFIPLFTIVFLIF